MKRASWEALFTKLGKWLIQQKRIWKLRFLHLRGGAETWDFEVKRKGQCLIRTSRGNYVSQYGHIWYHQDTGLQPRMTLGLKLSDQWQAFLIRRRMGEEE